MDPLSVFLIASAVASIGATGYAAHQQNVTSKRGSMIQARMAESEKIQLDLAAANEKAQATSDELDRQRTLKRVLATQSAIFGASGASLSSGTFANIQTSDTSRAAEATRLNQLFTDTRQLGYQTNKAVIDANTLFQKSSARIMRRVSGIQAGSSMLESGARAATLYNRAKTPNSLDTLTSS